MLSVDTKYKIAALSTFGVPEGAIVTVYEITIPNGEADKYIEKLFTSNVEKFRDGENSGLVKEVFENRKTKQGNFDALLVGLGINSWRSSSFTPMDSSS